MLEELLEERNKGRLEGPFRSPPDWPTPSVSPRGEELLDAPTTPVYAAFCFSVKQSDKLRRCEGHRRSHHNSTIFATDSQHHDGIASYVRLLLWWMQRCSDPVQVWAHDLVSAYRQIGARDTNYTYTSLSRHRKAQSCCSDTRPFLSDRLHQCGLSIVLQMLSYS